VSRGYPPPRPPGARLAADHDAQRLLRGEQVGPAVPVPGTSPCPSCRCPPVPPGRHASPLAQASLAAQQVL